MWIEITVELFELFVSYFIFLSFEFPNLEVYSIIYSLYHSHGGINKFSHQMHIKYFSIYGTI